MNMKLIMKMVSGKEYEFENKKYNTIDDWIKGNFDSSNSAWWKPNEESDLLIRIENIESICSK